MQNLNVQFEGVTEEDLTEILSELHIKDEAHTIVSSSRATGDIFLDLILKLSEIDLNALSLLVGYSVGKGISIFQVVSGKRQAIRSLKDATEVLEEAKNSD